MLEKYPKDVKLVEKNFPLQMHKLSRPAAAAALAALNQGKFWEYHHKIFENMSALSSDTKFLDMARELNLDLEKFSKDMNSPAIQNLITRDLSEGNQAKVSGTPTIFVNGKQLKDRSFEGFQNVIDAELRKKK